MLDQAIKPAPGDTRVVLSVKNLESYYGPIMAIRGVSLDVHDGQIVSILGANGAGKTTLLKTISGVMDPENLGSIIRSSAAFGAEDGVDGLLFRHVDERAGVDDEHVGEFGIRRERHAGLREVAHHDFGVDEVLRAAEGNETYGCHGMDSEMRRC